MVPNGNFWVFMSLLRPQSANKSSNWQYFLSLRRKKWYPLFFHREKSNPSISLPPYSVCPPLSPVTHLITKVQNYKSQLALCTDGTWIGDLPNDK
jgi:hypothetical protein